MHPALILASTLAAFFVALVIAINCIWSGPTRMTDCPPDSEPVAVASSLTTAPTLTPPASPTGHATATRTPAPTPTAVIGTLRVLQQRMEEAIASYPVKGRYAVAVTDLQTGETVSVHGDRRQLAGCSINLFVLFQVALDLQNGRYSLDTVDALISSTTWSSNATTARDLYGIVGEGDTLAGVARVDAFIRFQLGLTDTVLDHPPLYAEVSLGRGDNWLTVNDANRALVALWAGRILTPEWRGYLLSKLATVKPGLNYLTGSIPGAIVSHKNGFLEYGEGFVDNDLGIVRFTKGQEVNAFAISFLSEGVPTKYADVALGQQLVQLAFAYFSATAH